MGELQLEVKSLLDLVFASDRLRQLCREAQLGERLADDLELCFAEAVTASLMTHGARDVRVRFHVDDDRIELSLADDGEPLQTEELNRPAEILGKTSANGVQLLKLLTDELTYDAGPPNRLVLRRSRRRTPATRNP